MAARPKWKKLLQPYGDQYRELHKRFEAQVKAHSNAQLDELEAALREPTQSNIDWAVYESAPMLRSIVADEKRLRSANSSRPSDHDRA